MRQLPARHRFACGVALTVVLAAASVGCGALRTASARRLDPPIVTARAARLVGLSFDGVDIELDVQVENPNALGIDITGYDYRLEIAGERIAAGSTSLRRTVDGGAATEWTVPVSIAFASLLSSIASLASEDETTFAFECAVRVAVPFLGEVTLPVVRTGGLPLPRAPSIRFDGIAIRKASAATADLVVKLRVTNPNAFLLRLGSLSYSLGIGEEKWVSASHLANLEVFAHDSAVVDLPVQVDLGSVGLSAIALLRDPSTLPLLLSGAMDVTSPLPQMAEATAPFWIRALDAR